jgi:hypothetical protein
MSLNNAWIQVKSQKLWLLKVGSVPTATPRGVAWE